MAAVQMGLIIRHVSLTGRLGEMRANEGGSFQTLLALRFAPGLSVPFTFYSKSLVGRPAIHASFSPSSDETDSHILSNLFFP